MFFFSLDLGEARKRTTNGKNGKPNAITNKEEVEEKRDTKRPKTENTHTNAHTHKSTNEKRKNGQRDRVKLDVLVKSMLMFVRTEVARIFI